MKINYQQSISGSFRIMAMGLLFFVLAFVAENKVFSRTPVMFYDWGDSQTGQEGIDILYSDNSSSRVWTSSLVGGGAGCGLAVDSSGNFYLAQYGAGTILKVTPGGSASTFASGLNSPTELAFDSSGNLFVSTIGAIDEITPGGHESTFVPGRPTYGGLAFDQLGNLYASNCVSGGTVSKITPAGTVSTIASGLNGPLGLAFDASGNLYVAENGEFGPWDIKKINLQGNITTFASGGGLCEPHDIAFDSSGNLYADNWGGTISKITPDGSVSTFSTELGYNMGCWGIAPYSVPEPATLLLFTLGGLFLRKRK